MTNTTCFLFREGAEDRRLMEYSQFRERREGNMLVAYHFNGLVSELYRRQAYEVSVDGMPLTMKQRDRLRYGRVITSEKSSSHE